jgi:hypothetical protein
MLKLAPGVKPEVRQKEQKKAVVHGGDKIARARVIV